MCEKHNFNKMAAVDISFESWHFYSFYKKITFRSCYTLLASKNHSIFVAWCRIFEHHNVKNHIRHLKHQKLQPWVKSLLVSFIYPPPLMIETSIFMISQRKQVEYRNKGNTYKYLFCLIRRWQKNNSGRSETCGRSLRRPWKLSCTQYIFDSYDCSYTSHRRKSLNIHDMRPITTFNWTTL